jgi:hypothetical protein
MVQPGQYMAPQLHMGYSINTDPAEPHLSTIFLLVSFCSASHRTTGHMYMHKEKERLDTVT